MDALLDGLVAPSATRGTAGARSLSHGCPFPRGRPTANLPRHRACRSSGLSSNSLEKKSDEAPVRYYRPPIFRKEIRLWTSIASGHRGSNVCC